MYYNKLYRIWILDELDYFLISAFFASLLARSLKEYLSEKAKMDRLKQSLLNECRIANLNTEDLSHSEKTKKIQRIVLRYPFPRGGDDARLSFIDNSLKNIEPSEKLATQIQDIVLKLAAFLKQRSFKGALKIFFANGQVLFELILKQCCNIYLEYDYAWIPGQTNTQVMVIAIAAGTATGVTATWLNAGVTLLTPIIILSTFILRSGSQQIFHNIDYKRLTNQLKALLENEEIKKTLDVSFPKNELPYSQIEMDLNSDLKDNPAVKQLTESLGISEDTTFSTGKLEFDSNNNVIETVNKNPKKLPKKRPSKEVQFRDFKRKFSPDEFIDAEIIGEKPMQLRIDPDRDL